MTHRSFAYPGLGVATIWPYSNVWNRPPSGELRSIVSGHPSPNPLLNDEWACQALSIWPLTTALLRQLAPAAMRVNASAAASVKQNFVICMYPPPPASKPFGHSDAS